jgi:limonene-1,2-epoxide hydrolase
VADPSAVVEELLEGLTDLEAGAVPRAADAVVQDMMKAPQPALTALRGRWPGATGITSRVRTLAAEGPVVHVEHHDDVTMADGAVVTIECVGTYEVEADRVARARVYYDRATFYRRLGERRGTTVEDDGLAPEAPYAPVPLGYTGPDLGRGRAETPQARAARAFFQAWAAPDPAQLAAWWSPDGVFDNLPADSGPARRGTAEIEALWREWLDGMFFGVAVDVISLVAAGDRVFVERLDHVTLRDGRLRTLPCHAVVEFRGDRISAVRDHFDLGWFARAVRA